MLKLTLRLELDIFWVTGNGKDQCPEGCWLLRNARVMGADYDDADARVWPACQIRRVYLNQANGLSKRRSAEEQRIMELTMARKISHYTVEAIAAYLQAPVTDAITREELLVMMGRNPVDDSSSPGLLLSSLPSPSPAALVITPVVAEPAAASLSSAQIIESQT